MKVSELIDLLDKTEMLFKQTNAMLEAVEKHRTLAVEIFETNFTDIRDYFMLTNQLILLYRNLLEKSAKATEVKFV